ETFQKWIDDLRGAGKKPAAGAAAPRFQDFLYKTSPGVEAQRILNDDAVRALLIGIPRNSLPAFYDLLKKDAFLNATNLPPAFAPVQARIWQVFAEGPVRFGSKERDAAPRSPVMDEVQASLLRSAEQNARNPRYSITSRLDTPNNSLFEAQRILADPALLEMLNKLTPEQIDAVATAPGNGAFIGSPRRQLYGTALGEIIDRVSYLFDNGPFARGGLDARQRLEVLQLVEKKLAEAAKTAAGARPKAGAVSLLGGEAAAGAAPFHDHLLRTSPDIETHRVLTSNKSLELANALSIQEVETLAALAREGKFLSTRKFNGTALGDFQANLLAGFLRGPLSLTRPDGTQGLTETGRGVLRQAEADLAAAADKVLRMPRYHLGSRLYDDSPFTVDAQRVLADGRLQDLLNGMDAVAVDLLAEAKGDGLLLTDPRTAATSLG
ncbi:MAG TPA: hypothetical protein PK362_10635, partial [Elusimicrobiota bacterium]|nr:hypothetical protein [Elusimicrobiota bacterium]